MPDRSAFRPHGSLLPGVSRTASTPEPAAERKRVPKLPGSETASQTSTKDGAFGSGVAYTLVRKLAATEHPSVIVLYFPMVCIPATLLLGSNNFIWPDQMGWLALIGVGCFTQLGQLSLTKAMQTDSASKATSLSYLQIVFAAGLGWLLFKEIPATATFIGAGFILMGALISAGIPSKPQKKAHASRR